MIAPRQAIGHFVIVAKLGEGGMGEVWRATDTRLHRDVAIKVLPAALAHDAERVARLEREAHVLASLNHPNIAAVYGVELPAIVMELVEGETLNERLSRGAMPLDEALPIARQIADALEYAHDRGVIHRDLKPANIKVTPEGRVKVLDFGLAKLVTMDADSAASTETRTLTSPATLAGTILGTAAYMAPEQARGQTVDRRADVWAFGVVLYELLTGRRPFDGPTVSDTLAAVLKTEPAWDAVPPIVQPLVEECLRKDARDRRQCIGDIRLALEHLPRTNVAFADQPAPRGIGWRRASAMVTAALAIAAGAAAAGWFLRPSAPMMPVSFAIDLPAGRQFARLNWREIAISPDGTKIVYAGLEKDQRRLYLRPLDRPDASPIAGTEDAQSPFFSPDGQWIGFFQGSEDQNATRLMRVPVAGGPAEFVTNAADERGASWNLRGDLVLASLSSGLTLGAGSARPLTALGAGDLSHRLPEFTRTGDAVLFTVMNNRTGNQIRAQPLTGGPSMVVVTDATQPMYSATGHLLFVRDHTLMAVRVDAPGLTAIGQPVSMLGSISVSAATAAAQYSVSNNGTLIYVPGQDPSNAIAKVPDGRLEWVNRNGQEQPLPAPPRGYVQSRLSPDGRQAALTILGVDQNVEQIWTYDIARNTQSVLTPPSERSLSPIWAPNGGHIVYSSNTADIVWRSADGSGGAEPLSATPAGVMVRTPNAISPDGKLVVVSDRKLNDRGSLSTLNIATHQSKELVAVADPFIEFDASLSPDGKWMAFTTNTTGHHEVYVRPFPGPGARFQISSAGGAAPRWNPRGGELFFRSPAGVMAVSIDTRSTFVAGTPTRLFDLAGMLDWDPSPDGQRFLVIRQPTAAGPARPAAPPHPSTIIVVLNWAEELKRKLPR